MFAHSAYNKTKLLYDWSHLVWSACKSVISHLDYWRSFLHLKKRNSLKTSINFVRMVKLYINSCCTCLFTLCSTKPYGFLLLELDPADSCISTLCWLSDQSHRSVQDFRGWNGQRMDSCEAYTVVYVDYVALSLAFTEFSSFCTFEKYLHVFIWLRWS